MAGKLRNFLRGGTIPLGSYEFRWAVARRTGGRNGRRRPNVTDGGPFKLHFGPGAGWANPSDEWRTLDIDPQRGDITMDFRDYNGLPFRDETVEAIYASHTFEHVSIFVIDRLLEDCYRVLRPAGRIRIIVPDARESLRQYLEGNEDFPLFARRRARAKQHYGVNYTLFECMKEDFLSRSYQELLLGADQLAHQNAWDFDSLVRSLGQAGFASDKIYRSGFQESRFADFEFEGTYASEANEQDRSLYVEAEK